MGPDCTARELPVEVNREPVGKAVALGRHSSRSPSRLPSMKRWSGVRPLRTAAAVSNGGGATLWGHAEIPQSGKQIIDNATGDMDAFTRTAKPQRGHGLWPPAPGAALWQAHRHSADRPPAASAEDTASSGVSCPLTGIVDHPGKPSSGVGKAGERGWHRHVSGGILHTHRSS